MSADEITELAAAVAELGALPVPVGPEPQPLSVERLQLRVDEVERAHTFDTAELKRQLESARALGARVIHAEQRRAELEAVLGTHRKDDQAEIDRLRSRIAELETERHVTNEALDDAVQALRAGRASEPESGGYLSALPWAALMNDDDLIDFLDELTDAATRNVSCVERLAEVERACGTWRLIGEAQHGHNTAPGPDAMTRSFVPVASLREPEGEHYGALHHDYRVGHDLPETGAQEHQPDEDRLLGEGELRRALRGHLFGGGA